jgi:hypothetical protein
VHGELLRNKGTLIGHVSCANSLPIGIMFPFKLPPLPKGKKIETELPVQHPLLSQEDPQYPLITNSTIHNGFPEQYVGW